MKMQARKKTSSLRLTHKYGALSIALLCAFALLWSAADVRADEQDFDDGVVEDVQEELAAPGSADAEELQYESPKFDPKDFHFVDHFDNVAESSKRWVKSQAKKDDTADEIAKYDGLWQFEPPQRIVWKKDIGLVLKSKAKHAAISSRLHREFTFKDGKPLVVQYEVTMQDGQECGGSYIKLLSSGKQTEDLTKFNDKTPYTIMFGPDKCGNDHMMHFIFRHVNPINGTISEKHSRKPKERLEEPFKDKLPHLYQLVVRPDNTFEVRVDHKIVNEGNLLADFTPPVNPPREIDDPEDKKPEDWDEREKIPDPTAHKPEDWDDDAPPQIPDPTAVKPDGWLDDEPEMIPDPSAIKPEDWDTEIDGEWEAPLVDNPICEKAVGCGKWKAPLIPNKEYKGKWRAPMIDNPNYQGKWSPRKIPNPDFYEDLTPFHMTPISAVGLELWSMSSDILFDNLIITDNQDVAKDYAAKTFDVKRKYIDKESETLVSKVTAFANANPWAWKIAIVLLGTPLALTVYRLFSKNGPGAAGGAKDTAEDAKKTDAVQPDDKPAENAEASAETGAGDVSDKKKSSPKQKKSDLDVKEDSSAQKSSDNESEGENEAETEEGAANTSGGSGGGGGGGARKRRVRKDQS